MNRYDAARLLRQEKNAPMTIIEAAERLHIHPTSLSNLVKAGDLISGQKVKGGWEIEESEVARLLATRYEYNPEWIDVAAVARLIDKADRTVLKYIEAGEIEGRVDPLCMTRKLFVHRERLRPMERILRMRP